MMADRTHICHSISDIDPFAELVVGGQVNGRVEASSVTFDRSHLGPPLDSVTPRKCCTPEAFLGPTAASLINLDTLIPPKQHSQTQTLIPSNIPANNKNPFLSGETQTHTNTHKLDLYNQATQIHANLTCNIKNNPCSC